MGWVAGLPSAFHFVMISPKPPHAFPRAVNFFVRLGELARHAHKKIAPGFAGGFVISIGFEVCKMATPQKSPENVLKTGQNACQY